MRRFGNIRYARNTVTTSGKRKNMTVSIMSYFGKRSGTATLNEFDDDSLAAGVRQSEELAKLAPENPEFMEPLGPQTYQESKAFSETTATITPDSGRKLPMKGYKPLWKTRQLRQALWKTRRASLPL
jgi:predicted Zn-dependent protease